MFALKKYVKKRQQGQAMLEYVLIVTLVALVGMFAFQQLGITTNDIISGVSF